MDAVHAKISVSVVVPAYNAAGTIAGCLDSLTAQCGEGCEIIVVDDGSTDDTPEIARGYEKVRIISQKNRGPAAARNEGVRQASGELVLFTDSDCVPAPGWVGEMTAQLMDDPSVAGVKGAYRTSQKEFAARFVQCEYEDKYDLMKRERFIDFIDTYSACFRRTVFLAMGGYDTNFPVACAEDVELSYRMHEKGFRMVFNPGAVVYHKHPRTLRQYLMKKYKFAYWRLLAVKKNPKKAVRDSHTPQTMKLQMLLAPLALSAGAASLLGVQAGVHFVALSCAFLVTALPFTVKALRKDLMVGLASPAMLFLRGVFQFAGVAGGSVRLLRKG